MTTQKRLKNTGLALVFCAFAANAQGATTDLATAPLVTSSSTSVLPNLMFVLDDSGSMDWEYMPDNANNFNGDYGYATSQCNGVYYDPAITYTPPVDATGASYANSSFTAAWNDGYNTGSGTTNLSTSFRPSSSYTSQAAFYYTYSGAQTTTALKDYYTSGSLFYQECNSAIGSAPGSGVFTKVTVGASEKQNFANWFSYYRNRINMMKTAAGLAFKPIDNHYRVGFMTINNNVSPAFLNLATFDSAQKSLWYAKLYASNASNSTPLREALATAGRIYAGKVSSLYGTTVNDPVQYSCQQNFTILSTDGFWNGTSSSVKQINGTTTMGNEDGSADRPYYDGSVSTAVTTESYTTEEYRTSGCAAGQKKIRSTPTSRTITVTTAPDGTTSTATSAWVAGSATTVVGCTANAAIRALQAPNPSAVTSTTGATTTAGTSNTLADVAQYYYTTDLRTSALGNATGVLGTDVAENNVPSSGLDAASWQHMTTFTLGLGVRGRMVYSPTYLTDTSGDYFSVKNGSSAGGGVCPWQASGACNWPVPAHDTPEAVDDLWHAAVNGRGTYFSATNPSTLAAGLGSTLAGVSARTGASAAATTSNPNVTSGDNFVFSSTFTTQEWDGQLVRQQLDLTTGITSATIDWAAQALLDGRVSAASDSRTIYTYDSTVASHLKPFLWGNLTAAEQAYFNTANISTLSQLCATGATCLSAADQTLAAGANLVNFLRGQRGNEGISTDTSKYYRQRIHTLGDIVNAEAVYVKGSLFTYSDTGYTDFITANATRQGEVYAAANDGMLHAFNSSTGVESWAYMPSLVLPNLFKLADKNYTNLHQYFVDGTPAQGDVYFSGTWHTILVGGLNGGGRGYYALDITDPASPKALWEFTDTNLGYTYGNPEITKLKDGTWVVLVASGYNNVSPGDGVGRLYVLNAATGAIIRSISTGVGSTGTPSGLAHIRAWADNAMSDNTAQRVYGGDLLGNLWRFDINGDVGAAGFDAQLLATLKDSAGNAQPITTKPEIGEVSGNAIVYVGTGRYLGTTDMANTSQQTIYAIKDKLGTASYGNPRTYGQFIQQTAVNTTCPGGAPATLCSAGQAVRTSSSNVVNLATDNGWYIDLPDSGERANTDPSLALGTLVFNTNVPNTSACTVGGYSWGWFLDYRTGAPVSTAVNVSARKLGNALATRPVLVRLPNNTIVELTRLSDGTTLTSSPPIGSGATVTRRVSWRELISE